MGPGDDGFDLHSQAARLFLRRHKWYDGQVPDIIRLFLEESARRSEHALDLPPCLILKFKGVRNLDDCILVGSAPTNGKQRLVLDLQVATEGEPLHTETDLRFGVLAHHLNKEVASQSDPWNLGNRLNWRSIGYSHRNPEEELEQAVDIVAEKFAGTISKAAQSVMKKVLDLRRDLRKVAADTAAKFAKEAGAPWRCTFLGQTRPDGSLAAAPNMWVAIRISFVLLSHICLETFSFSL
jgi:hypothetical protein